MKRTSEGLGMQGRRGKDVDGFIEGMFCVKSPDEGNIWRQRLRVRNAVELID